MDFLESHRTGSPEISGNDSMGSISSALNLDLVRKFLLQRIEKTLPVRVVQQPLDNLCWATCYRMVDNWFVPNNGFTWCRHARCGSNGATCLSPMPGCNFPRLTSDVQEDWLVLGYSKTIHKQSALTVSDVRTRIKAGFPVMIFLEFTGQAIGHFCLIVGTARMRLGVDTSFVIADPLNEKLIEREATDLLIHGTWRQSWEINT